MWKNKPDMAKKWTDEHGSTPVKAGLGDLVTGLARRVFRKKGTAHADSSQAKIMGDPEGKLLDYFKTKYSRSARPIQAKKGKYQEFEHPQHNITPLEHMEERVSSKERIERLLDERKKKKEGKEKLVKAQEGQLIREKTRGTGVAVKGTDHYVMQGMDAAQEGKLIQVPTRGTGQAVKGDQHYVMEGMDAAKEGKMIKAQSSKFIEEPPKWISSPGKRKRMGRKPSRGIGPKKISKEWIEWKKHDLETGGSYKTGGPIKAKKGLWTGAATDMYDKPPGWDVKKISDKTHKKLTKLWKYREAGGYKEAKDYKRHLKALKKITPSKEVAGSTFLKRRMKLDVTGTKGFKESIKGVMASVKHIKEMRKTSPFLQRRFSLAGFSSVSGKSNFAKALAKATAIGKVGKAKAVPLAKPSDFLSRRMTLGSVRTLLGKTKIGKVALAGAAAYGIIKGIGTLKSPSKEKILKEAKKKKVTKKSIGGETVIMKSGGGYIDDLL